MRERERDPQSGERCGPGPGVNADPDDDAAGGMERSTAARAEMEQAFHSVSDAAVRRVLSRNHGEFLRSVRQSGGQ